MNHCRLFILYRMIPILLVILSSGTVLLHAQSGGLVVNGTVVDETKTPIVGAGIVIKGTHDGAVSDLDGNFTITVPDSKTVLEISYLGYKTLELKVGNSAKLFVQLTEDATFLESSVAVAYGTQKRATVTGALTTIDTDKLVKAPVADITNVLAGQMPGVSTIQNTGQPGADGAQIFIRGVSSLSNGASAPLILVDGVERPMSSIDPNEIENLSILKDASATAVFGVRGANGVIIITTKRGDVGKPTISVSTVEGIQVPMAYVEQTGSYEYAKFWNLKMLNDKITDPKAYFTREAIEAYRIGSDPIMFPNTNWTDEIFKKAFFQSKNNINISGGTENVRYFVSLGFFTQDGILKSVPNAAYDNNFKYNRYNFRANLDFKLTPSTTMKFNLGGVIGQKREPRSLWLGDADGELSNAWVYTTIWTVPMSSPGLINGLRTFVPETMAPDVEMRDGYGAFYGNGYSENFNGSVNIDVDITQSLDVITEGLSLSAKGSFDARLIMDKVHRGYGMETQTVYYKTHLEDNSIPMTDPDYDKTLVYVPSGQTSPLSYSSSTGKDRNWYLECRLNYDRTFDSKHSVSALLLYNQSRNYYPNLSDNYIPRSYVGAVARVTYGYKNKYLFDLNAGYNGSENFAPGRTRYGFFPAASVGWVMSEEPWMQRQNVISFLKFRFSAGMVGNDMGSSSRFMYMNSVWTPGGSYNFGVNNPNSLPFYTTGTPGNPKASWEKSMKYNVGVDMNMFNDRLNLTAEYFFENRTNILITPNSTPPIIATGLPDLNLGHVTNQGYEISLGWADRLQNTFNYSVDANVSFARNKIIDMDEVKSEFGYKMHTGGSTGRYDGLYEFERLYQESDFIKDKTGNLILNPELPQPNSPVYPGDAMYADLNNDMIVDGRDTKVDGFSTRPEYIFGLNASIGYKGFALSMNWIGATNVNKMMQIEYRIPYTNAGSRGLLKYFYEDCWTLENPNGTLPRAAETTEQWNSAPSTLWLRDASYIRLKSLTLGYTFASNKFFKKLGISSLGLTFTGYNLLTFSPCKFEDPEAVADNLGLYPLIKTFNFGLNINF